MALILREEDVRLLLTMQDTVCVLEGVFNAQSQGLAVNQPRTRFMLPTGAMNMLAAAAPAFGVMGTKTYTAFRDGVRFVVMLFSTQDGQLLAIIEADWLDSMRTGGTSAVATKYLADPDATTVGLIGAGNQAITQLMGVCTVCPITTVYVYSRQPQKCELFCREMTRLLDIEVVPVDSAQEAVEEADILITATTASEPVVRGEWVKPGCHINAIGSNWAQRRELDSATIQRCTCVVTDSLEQAQSEAGDLIIPANEGLFDWRMLRELAEIITDPGPLRESPEDITLYKGLGVALADVVTAAHVYHQACKHGIGEEINFLP